tara:strand:+ start:365 stop:784 length:420 start_codon:yes stop_codon:yes gene_type:complete
MTTVIVEKKEAKDVNGRLLKVGDKVKVVEDIKYPTVTIGQGVIGHIHAFTEDNNPQVSYKHDNGTGFICSGSSLEKIDLTSLEKDLIALLKDITYQTGYMTNSWGDTSMLSQMAIEDKISPWSIESEVEKFAKKHDLKL